jgi:broad specificity phosphatase PhoE
MRLIKLLFTGILFCAGISQVFAEEGEPKTRFLYIRHAEVPGNDPSASTYTYTGSQTDESLTETGKRQAQECAERVSNLQKSGVFGNITAIYSSNLKRAQETAAPIAEALGFDVQVRGALQEIDWGCGDGQLVTKMTEEYRAIEHQVKQLYPERKTRWDHLPVFEGAETFNALLNRNIEELKGIAESHPGETVLIIGHGRVLKTLIADARDSEEGLPHLSNCSIVEFTYSQEEGLRFINVVQER